MASNPEHLKAINGWKQLSHTQLAIFTQALYSIASDEESTKWIREAAVSIGEEARNMVRDITTKA